MVITLKKHTFSGQKNSSWQAGIIQVPQLTCLWVRRTKGLSPRNFSSMPDCGKNYISRLLVALLRNCIQWTIANFVNEKLWVHPVTIPRCPVIHFQWNFLPQSDIEEKFLGYRPFVLQTQFPSVLGDKEHKWCWGVDGQLSETSRVGETGDDGKPDFPSMNVHKANMAKIMANVQKWLKGAGLVIWHGESIYIQRKKAPNSKVHWGPLHGGIGLLK